MIYPNEFPGNKDHNNPEWNVFMAMKDLPNDFDVYYTKTFSAKSSRERPEYEIDFIVVDLRNRRFNSLICVEVKGGEPKIHADETWTSNGKSMKSPVKQVSGAMHSLVERYPEISRDVPFGWMLCFPDTYVPGSDKLPECLRHTQIVDRIKLSDLNKAIISYINYLKPFFVKKKGLELSYYKPFKEKLIVEYSFIMPLAKRISLDEEVFIKLTADQAKALKMVRRNPNLIIKGTAGSGKTIIAIETAREFSAQGLDILFLCYNKVLVSNIQNFFLQLENIYHNGNRVRVETYHSYAYEIINKAEPGWWNENIRKPNFWDLVVPVKITEIRDSAGIKQDYDVLIIDEGQDFNEYWFATAEYSLKPAGKFYIFMDEFQDINNKHTTIPSARNFLEVLLDENCRNTRNIALKLKDIIRQEILSKEGIPDGKPVVTRQYLNDTEQVALITAELENLLNKERIRPDHILIMLNTNIKDSCLSETPGICNLELQELNDRGELRDNVINYTQIGTFKGLEADIVFIVDTHLAGYDPARLYTQASRAKHLLYIFEKVED